MLYNNIYVSCIDFIFHHSKIFITFIFITYIIHIKIYLI